MCGACTQSSEPAPRLDTLIPAELWKAANHGRLPLGSDGYFRFPQKVARVVVDVGAYKLKVTSRYLREPDVGIVAVEPMREPWATWPNRPRIIGVPAAIDLEPGMLEFNVNAADVTSSLLETAPDATLSSDTIEVRRVPGVTLEDVLARIPPDMEIPLLKTDTQGTDLAVLMSAGDQLRRVHEVLTEIVFDPSYEREGPGTMSTEREFDDFMKSMGFRRVPKGNEEEYRRWFLNATYVNDAIETNRRDAPAP